MESATRMCMHLQFCKKITPWLATIRQSVCVAKPRLYMVAWMTSGTNLYQRHVRDTIVPSWSCSGTCLLVLWARMPETDVDNFAIACACIAFESTSFCRCSDRSRSRSVLKAHTSSVLLSSSPFMYARREESLSIVWCAASTATSRCSSRPDRVTVLSPPFVPTS